MTRTILDRTILAVGAGMMDCRRRDAVPVGVAAGGAETIRGERGGDCLTITS